MRALGVGIGVGFTLLVAAGASSYPDDLPPGYAGNAEAAFCASCHSGSLGAGEPRVALSGLPKTATAGETYAIGVHVSHPALVRAGFLLSAPGRFLPGDDVSVARGADGAHYATHAAASTWFEASAAWTLQWRAPDSPGNLAFHLVVNAANGDESPLGDSVVALTRRVEVRRAR